MSLAPLLAAPAAVQVHAIAAIAALGIGLALLVRRKGDPAHRLLGRLWVGLTGLVALSSFLVTGPRAPGEWSPLHFLSVATLAGLVHAVAMARAGRIRAHRAAMTSLLVGSLVVPGGFALAPGRLMHAVVLGPAAQGLPALAPWGWPALALAAGLGTWLAWRAGTGRAPRAPDPGSPG